MAAPPQKPPRGEGSPPAPGMIRLKLVLAYDGGAFEGWQSQASGNTVQDALERAVLTLAGERRTVHGSGRTDSGVHATGQIAHVDVPAGRLDVAAWEGALNGHLPRTVRILSARKASPRFHARFSASGKLYTYRIWNARCLHPLELGRAWHIPSPLDQSALEAAATLLCGTHDFAAFAANRGRPDEDTVRTIHRISLKKTGPLFTLRFHGNGFLYRMVRLLTGSMVRVAQAKTDLAWLKAFLEAPEKGRSSFCAPPDGLFLTRVLYGRPSKP